MGAIAPGHLIILVAVLLLLFGARRLPEIGRGIGQGMREFKESLTGDRHEREPEADARPADAPPSREAQDAVAAGQVPPPPAPEAAQSEEANRPRSG